MERCKKIARGAAAGLLSAAVLMSSMLTTSFGQMRASAAEVRNPQATLTVDPRPSGEHGRYCPRSRRLPYMASAVRTSPLPIQ